MHPQDAIRLQERRAERIRLFADWRSANRAYLRSIGRADRFTMVRLSVAADRAWNALRANDPPNHISGE